MNWKCKFFSKLSIVDFHKIIYSPISVPIVWYERGSVSVSFVKLERIDSQDPSCAIPVFGWLRIIRWMLVIVQISIKIPRLSLSNMSTDSIGFSSKLIWTWLFRKL
jgi:hypothetical protein